MTKKQPLHTRVANLEQNQTEMMRFLNGLIESHNKVLVGLETAFAKIGRRTAELDKRIESMENAMLMGDFKTKLPDQQNLKNILSEPVLKKRCRVKSF